MDNQDQICLFDGDSLSGYLGARQRAVAGVVDGIHQQEFLAAGDDTLVRQVVDQLAVTPLVLHLDQMQSQQSETKISRMVETDDYGMPVRRQQMVRAIRMSHLIPFSGDGLLWQMNNGPRMECLGSVDAERGQLTLTFENTPNADSRWYQRRLEEALAQIDRVVQDQTRTIAEFHRNLAEAAERAVAMRRRQTQA